jgi:hypothetical protein
VRRLKGTEFANPKKTVLSSSPSEDVFCTLETLLEGLMMEAARTSETLVNFYQTTQRYNPEDSHLCTHRHENLKSYLVKMVFMYIEK